MRELLHGAAGYVEGDHDSPANEGDTNLNACKDAGQAGEAGTFGQQWSSYRCEGRWERAQDGDDDYKYALKVKNYRQINQGTKTANCEPVSGTRAVKRDIGDIIFDMVRKAKLPCV